MGDCTLRMRTLWLTCSRLNNLPMSKSWHVDNKHHSPKGVARMLTPKKPRGRPPKYVMPPLIDAPPETIAEVVLRAKPKDKWRYEEETGRKRRQPRPS